MRTTQELVAQFTDVSILPPEGSKVVQIISGGMDSVTLLHFLTKHLKCEVTTLSFNYGQKHVRELQMAKANAAACGVNHQIIDLPFISELFKSDLLSSGGAIPEGHYEAENMKQTVVPNRNMIMASIAVGYGQSLGFQYLSLGVHAGDHAIYPDCRAEFIEAFKGAVELSDWNPFSIRAPFQRMTKVEILEMGLSLSPAVDYSTTWTCYKGEESACGVCGSCQERLAAFAACGMEDPLPYTDRETWKQHVK